jgi:hypothetical protein
MGRKGKVVGLKVSRMDPFETYDAGALAQQLAQCINDENRLRADAYAFLAKADKMKEEQQRLSELIKRVNERDKKRKAAGGA